MLAEGEITIYNTKKLEISSNNYLQRWLARFDLIIKLVLIFLSSLPVVGTVFKIIEAFLEDRSHRKINELHNHWMIKHQEEQDQISGTLNGTAKQISLLETKINWLIIVLAIILAVVCLYIIFKPSKQ